MKKVKNITGQAFGLNLVDVSGKQFLLEVDEIVELTNDEIEYLEVIGAFDRKEFEVVKEKSVKAEAKTEK